MSTVLVLDVNNLAWRAFHVFRELGHVGVPTGATFGFLRDYSALHRKYRPDVVVFCFDGEGSVRRKGAPGYKQSRRPRTKAEEEARGRAARQIRDLRVGLLPRLGARNVLAADGFEADDVIASVCLYSVSPGDEVIIVSNDRDLYQLLAANVRIWNGRKHVTLQSFHADWGLHPGRWPDVKAIAGCPSDDVRGVAGVGEKSAAQYLRNEMTPTTFRYRQIRANWDLWRANIPLVRLPHEGTPVFPLRPDEPSPAGWREVCKELGMDSLLGECPFVPECTLFGGL